MIDTPVHAIHSFTACSFCMFVRIVMPSLGTLRGRAEKYLSNSRHANMALRSGYYVSALCSAKGMIAC